MAIGKIILVIVVCAIALYGLQYYSNSAVLQNAISSISGKLPVPQTITNQVSHTAQTILNASSTISQSVKSTTEILSPKPTPTQQELYQYALKIINEDRKSHGVAPVSLSDVSSAQNHADDMLKSKYFSHWNTNGVKPYVTYTRLGGKGNINENISYVEAHCLSGNCFANSYDPYKQISDSEHSMMYDDAASNWGHRDNIIDPNHTHVNFGISYNNDRFYFVENFENNIINWETIQMNGNQLHLAGIMPAGYSFKEIDVFGDPEPKALTGQDLDSQLPYNTGHYDQGDLVAMIVPQLSGGYYYQECAPGKLKITSNSGQQCIDYITFANTPSNYNINISVDLSKWMGPGLHTIYLELNNSNGKQVSTTSLTLEYLK